MQVKLKSRRHKYDRKLVVCCLLVLLVIIFLWQSGRSPEEIEADVEYLLQTAGGGNPRNKERLQCITYVLDNLPIGKGRRPAKKNPQNLDAVFAHHYDANTGKWNADDRFKPIEILKTNPNCSVWEVGAYKEAADSQEFLKSYGKCQYHAFEPIPDFYVELEKKWAKEPRVHTHNFGIGAKASTFRVSPESLKDQSTYIGDQKEGSIEAHIKDFHQVIELAGKQMPTLLHMNCEGCEWTLIPEGLDDGFIQAIPVIQIGTHNYGDVGLGARIWQLCDISLRLSETHYLVDGKPFGWERWVRRDLLGPKEAASAAAENEKIAATT